ncbi:MAG: tyrosine-type recombinase/integrase [Bacteroidales bacterium]|nr:tyrosine-type recombinase/integrase [Bacteroidales bacterium]
MKPFLHGKQLTELIPGYLNGELIVKIYFEFNKELIEAIKTIPGRRWNQEFRYWYIPKKRFNLPTLLKTMESLTQIDYSALEAFDNGSEYSQKQEPPPNHHEIDPIRRFEASAPAQNIELPPGYLERLERKRYSQNTIKSYLGYMKDFVKEQKGKDLQDITPEEINAYILRLIRIKGISPSQQNQRINAIKFYYEKVLGQEKRFYTIERPKKSRTLPKVLTETEVLSVLKSLENIKHKAIIGTIYSSGLRRGELINLRKQDIVFENKMLIIRGGKGKKDRTSVLSDFLAIVLRKYLELHKPNYWLFEGPNRKQYSATSISKILDRAARKAGIERKVTPHMLRHYVE